MWFYMKKFKFDGLKGKSRHQFLRDRKNGIRIKPGVHAKIHEKNMESKVLLIAILLVPTKY